MITDIEFKKKRIKFDYILKDQVYDNIEFYSPSGELMFLGSNKKVIWYTKKDLIKKIDDNKYQFLFEPKGKGHYNESDFDTSQKSMKCMPKQTICVVSGKNTHLTRHHIVPAAYVKYFLFEDYTQNRLQHHDIVLLNNSIHEEYENKALFLKDKLCKKYDITSFKESCKIQQKAFTAAKQGKKLLEPSYIQNNKHYKKELQLYCFKQNIQISELQDYVSEKEQLILDLDCHYKQLSEKLDTLELLQDFCEIWRKHFIDTMKPKFLPKNWSIKTKISPSLK